VIDHTVKSYDKELDTLERRIAEMGGVAEKMLVDAMDSLANSDSALAREVVATDPRVDALPARAIVMTARSSISSLDDSVFRETYMMEDPRNISLCAHLLF
jgi:phosphate uptake regulator